VILLQAETAHAAELCDAQSVLQSVQQQLQQEQCAYEQLVTDSSERDHQQQEELRDLQRRLASEQDNKVARPAACLLP
jgi:hypothetical protein